MLSFSTALTSIRDLQLQNGGFPYQRGESARPDATSWAIVALSRFAEFTGTCERGRAYLVSQQSDDGAISISSQHLHATWPTPLAIFAWHKVPKMNQARSLAVDYLLNFSGVHWPIPNDQIMGHDTSIVGWPWITNTHSWVIPTSMAILALQLSGMHNHERVLEGTRMLLNRQLPRGGWNSGNTLVFGKELLPLPECTAIALQGLSGNTQNQRIEKSLDYLLQQLPNLRTPISLGWTLLGLGAWGLKPRNTEDLVLASLQLQERHGPYSIPSLALLLCALHAPQGLLSLFENGPMVAS